MQTPDERFMHRCLRLARLGSGSVSPNPLVGAVLVSEGKIIGEGWHQKFGGPHAEVHAVRSVRSENQRLVSKSTLYCSLEPCFHFGKTSPCVDLILEQKIPRVVLACQDPNPETAGQSIQKMREAGIEVVPGILEAEGRRLNRAFFKWILEKKPFILLKWAQSRDGFLAKTGERTAISGPAAQRLVHKWRAESDAILVGTTTAVTDNPRLDSRLFDSPPGKSLLRLAVDFQGKIPLESHLLDDRTETWILGKSRTSLATLSEGFGPEEIDNQGFGPDGREFERTRFLPVAHGWRLIPDLEKALFEAGRAILLVEGGANLLGQFIEQNAWDEIRVIENEGMLRGGVSAPRLPEAAVLEEQFAVGGDFVRIFGR